MRALATTILSSGALLVSAGCSELAGSGELVEIPSVSFACNEPNCTGAGGNNQFRVVYSSFDCSGTGSNGSFYTKALSNNFTLSCNGAQCTGTASSWSDENGFGITQIPAETYTVCVVIFRSGSITTGANAQDAWGELPGVSVTSSTAPVFVGPAFFTNGAPPSR